MKFFFKIPLILIILSLLTLFTQCNSNNSGKSLKDPSRYKEPLIKANKEIVREENEQIDDFIRRHNWEMETTSTGLRIMITKHGIGAIAQPGKTVKLSYVLTLLTGDTVYTALKDGPLVFDAGKGQVISGLEEAILLLRVGDRAKIIIPSHLAFGLIGDQKKIHSKASLVYDMEFISMY
jgi:FKBP-type peptidyl-prolyl cis-trans isomerase FkpA